MRRIFIAGILLAAVAGAFLVWIRPPAEWFERDYRDAAYEDVFREFDALAPRAEFKIGTGWIVKRFPVENQLQIINGRERTAPGEEKIALVIFERWVTDPASRRTRLTRRFLFEDPSLELIGGL